MDRFQYFLVLVGCIAITLPLEFVFRARVYRRPRRLVLALLPMLVVFIAWDAWAIARGTWYFNDAYVTGWLAPGSIPYEEIAFFVVIPICGLLSLEAVRNIVDPSRRTRRDEVRSGG